NRRTNKATALSGEPYEPGGAQRLGAGGAASAGAGREADIRAKMRVLNEDWLMLHPDATPAQISAQNFEHRKQAEKELAGAKAAPRADRNIEVRDETTNELLYRGEARKTPEGSYVEPNGRPIPEGRIIGIGTPQPRTESQMLAQKFLDENPKLSTEDFAAWKANRILNESVMRAMGGGPLARNIVAL